MGTDYSSHIVVDEQSETINLAVREQDVEALRSFLSANGIRQIPAYAATATTNLTFGSDVDVDNLRTILKRYAEVS